MALQRRQTIFNQQPEGVTGGILAPDLKDLGGVDVDAGTFGGAGSSVMPGDLPGSGRTPEEGQGIHDSVLMRLLAILGPSVAGMFGGGGGVANGVAAALRALLMPPKVPATTPPFVPPKRRSPYEMPEPLEKEQ